MVESFDNKYKVRIYIYTICEWICEFWKINNNGEKKF